MNKTVLKAIVVIGIYALMALGSYNDYRTRDGRDYRVDNETLDYMKQHQPFVEKSRLLMKRVDVQEQSKQEMVNSLLKGRKKIKNPYKRINLKMLRSRCASMVSTASVAPYSKKRRLESGTQLISARDLLAPDVEWFCDRVRTLQNNNKKYRKRIKQAKKEAKKLRSQEPVAFSRLKLKKCRKAKKISDCDAVKKYVKRFGSIANPKAKSALRKAKPKIERMRTAETAKYRQWAELYAWDAIIKKLNDPGSAINRGVKLLRSDGGKHFLFQVRVQAKNGWGGYIQKDWFAGVRVIPGRKGSYEICPSSYPLNNPGPIDRYFYMIEELWETGCQD